MTFLRTSVRPFARTAFRLKPFGSGSILCFHSVTLGRIDDGSPHVSPHTFRAVIEAARDSSTIVPLRELIARHRDGRSTRNMLAITFDDAYAALLEPDVTFLRTAGIPFTVFVTTDASSEGRSFWWDRVHELYARVSAERWRTFESACCLPEPFREGQPVEFGPLRPLRQWILFSYQGRSPAHVEAALSTLEEECGHRTSQRAMTFAELDSLVDPPLVEIGVHTCSHAVLPLLSDDDLAREVRDCHRLLQDRFPGVLPTLAAPFGLFDERSIRIAREVGMKATLTLESRTFGRSGGEDWLPRFGVCEGERYWKLMLRLGGVVERWRDWSRGTSRLPPELPSIST